MSKVGRHSCHAVSQAVAALSVFTLPILSRTTPFTGRRVKPRFDGSGGHQPSALRPLVDRGGEEAKDAMDEDIIDAPGGGAEGLAHSARAAAAGDAGDEAGGDSQSTVSISLFEEHDTKPKASSSSGGGGGGGGGQGAGAVAASSFSAAAFASAAAAAGAAASVPSPSSAAPASAAAATAATAASAASAAHGNGGGGGGGGGAGAAENALPPAAAGLLSAFQEVMALAGMNHEQEGRNKLERLQRAVRAWVAGGDFVVLTSEMHFAFSSLWVAVSKRLSQERLASQASLDAAATAIRARLEAHGLAAFVDTVLQQGSVNALRERRTTLLAHHGWDVAGLERRGQELQTGVAEARAAAAKFAGFLRNVPGETADQWRAGTAAVVRALEERLGYCQEVIRVRKAMNEVYHLVTEFGQHRERAAALQLDHEGRLHSLWGGLCSSVPLKAEL